MEQNNRIAYLDGIRGLASLVVFFYHYFLSFYPALFTLRPEFSHTTSNMESTIGKTPLTILYSGGFAVCVFFVLSGYVLSHKYFVKRDYSYLASSAIKRYFRLAIPILASVLISYLILLANGYTNAQVSADYTKCTFWFSSLWNIRPDIFEALKEGLYSALFEGKTLNYNSVLWTMNLEFMGSMLVFTILALSGHQRKRYIIYLILVLLFWKGFMVAFIAGLALCDYYTTKERKPLKPIYQALLLLPLFYFGSYQKIDGDSIWQPINFLSQTNNIYPFLIGSVTLLIIVINSRKLQRLLSHKWFGFLGKVSFSLYLLHLLILGSFSCFLFKLFYADANMNYFSSFLCNFLISLALALFLSYLMYRFIDSKATRLSSNIYKWIFKPTIN